MKCSYLHCHEQLPFGHLTFETKLFEHVLNTSGPEKDAVRMQFCRAQTNMEETILRIRDQIPDAKRLHHFTQVIQDLPENINGCYHKHMALQKRLRFAAQLMKKDEYSRAAELLTPEEELILLNNPL
jgi:hypothetical protein